MDHIKFILDIFGLVPTDIPKYTLFIIIFGLMIWIFFHRQFKPLKKAIRNIETFCTRLSTFLISRPEIPDGAPGFNPALGVDSPVRLRSVAYTILKDSGAEKVIKDNKDLLYKTLQTFRVLRTALDVQLAASKTLIISQDNPIFDKVKLFAYQYPEYKTEKGKEFKVNFNIILGIMSIRLRNLYLEEHPKIPRKWTPEDRRVSENHEDLFFGDSNKALTREEVEELDKSNKEDK